MDLTSQNVEKVFMECLFQEGEDTANAVIVEGITSKFGFHPERVEKNTQNISEMLSQLPVQFKKANGGGWSFLNACNNKDGEQWTGMHQKIEQLMCLGLAVKKVEYIMPRKMWSALPGGMPYFAVV